MAGMTSTTRPIAVKLEQDIRERIKRLLLPVSALPTG